MPSKIFKTGDPITVFHCPTYRERIILTWGAVRRHLAHVFFPGKMRKSIAARKGQCNRCGACCHLFRDCTHIVSDHKLSACDLYGRYRPPNCRNFPINNHDLADRDVIMPNQPCGFYWEEHQKK